MIWVIALAIVVLQCEFVVLFSLIGRGVMRQLKTDARLDIIERAQSAQADRDKNLAEQMTQATSTAERALHVLEAQREGRVSVAVNQQRPF